MVARPHIRLIGISLILILLGIVCGVWWWRDANARTRVILLRTRETLERDVDENIPRGSSKPEVERYLKSKNIVYVSQDLATEPGAGAATQIEGRTPQETRVPIGACFVLVSFTFDRNDKLLETKYRTTCKSIL